MKKFKPGVIGVAVYFGVLLLPLLAQMPLVFHATQTAFPGDIIGLQGGNFGTAPQVWMQHVIGTEPSLSPLVQLPMLNSSVSNNYVASQIPLTETVGLYAIWVKNGSNLSTPIFINQARAWGANDLAGTKIDPSRSFRLFGRNLFIPGATPTVNFVNGATILPATVTTNGSDANALQVTAPAGLVAGAVYTVNVLNGLGGSYGQTSLSYTLTGRAGGTDPFGLGVPWGADFTFYTNVYNIKTDQRLTLHAVGDGTNDDTPAITAAINVANAAGGGVVYLPTGTYLGKTSLTLKSKVVLKGDGPTLSTWKCQSTNLMSGYAFYEQGITNAGLFNICIYNTTNGYGYNSRGIYSSNLFILNSTLKTDVGKNTDWGANSQIVLKNSTFISTQTTTNPGAFGQPVLIQRCTDEVFSGNTVGWYFCRAFQDYCTRTLIENNNFTRYVFGTTSSTESGGISIGQSDSLVLLNNVFNKGGSGPLAWNYNDGETILCQGGGSPPLVLYSFGTVSSATATTLTDTTQSWTNNYSLPESSTQDHHYYISIVSGPGLGQLRQVVSNTTTTVTIDSPWDIIPTSASEYAINPEGARHVLVKGNSLTGNPRGLEFYKTSTEDLSIINNTLTDNGAIWLWPVYATAAWCDVQMDTEVVGNYVSKSTNLYSINYPGSLTKIFVQTSAGVTDIGTHVFGMEFRHNTIQPMSPNIATGFGGEGFAAESDAVNNTNVGMLGVIFQNNLAINSDTAYCISTGDYATTLWGNSASNVNAYLLDYEYPGTTLASTSTEISAPPVMMGALVNGQFVLTWSAGFLLQSTTNLVNPVWMVEAPNSPLTIIPGATGSKFYRAAMLTRINDTDPGITYSSGWVYSANRGAGDYYNDVHDTSVNGNYAQYAFTGTGVRYVTETYSDEGNVDVYLDGVFQRTVNCNTATRQVQQFMYSATNLAYGSHTIKIVKTSGNYILLDAFDKW